tara:strand:+ start:1115 stop:1951 length:837 start_codon:yes stop_codon:yes gene_type:complete
MAHKRLTTGFTLIELITVIIVLGVVSVGISGFIRTGVEIYSNVTERDQIIGESRFLVERLNRELRSAIPNSVRVGTNSSESIQCIEFVPAEWVSFYTSLSVHPDTSNSATIVEFADNPVGFQLQPDDFAIVYPTSNADIYNLSNNKRKKITACNDDDGDCGTLGDANRTAKLTLTGPFPDFSPASRLYVARKLVSYCANSNGNIYRNQGGINPTMAFHSSGVLMAENMKNQLSEAEEAPFRVFDATLTRNSLVQILLSFERNEEIINYLNEVHFPNVP